MDIAEDTAEARCADAIIELLADRIMRGVKHPAGLACIVIQVHSVLCSDLDLTHRAVNDALLLEILDRHAQGPQVAAILERLIAEGRVVRVPGQDGRELFTLNAPVIGERIEIAVGRNRLWNADQYEPVPVDDAWRAVLVPAVVTGYSLERDRPVLLCLVDDGVKVRDRHLVHGVTCNADLSPYLGRGYRRIPTPAPAPASKD